MGDTRDAGGDVAGDVAAVLRPVRAGNGFEEALEQILQVLRLGLVAEGERLPSERELAGRLGVSRMTLREVLKVLQDEGLVESRRGRYGGTFVRGGGPGASAGLTRAGTGAGALGGALAEVDIEDTLRLREVLDVGAAGLAAADAADRADPDPAAARRLRAALAGTREAPLADYRRADTLLHLTLAELSGSPSLAAQYAAVRARLNELLDRIPLLVRNLEHSQAQHAALVEAVLAGDAPRAREVMREHCAGTAALLRGFLAGGR